MTTSHTSIITPALRMLAFLFTTAAGTSRLLAAAGGSAPETSRETLLSLLEKGGPVMYPLGLCSVIALAIAIERFLSLRHQRVVPAEFLEGLKSAWDGRLATIDAGVGYCDRSDTPVGRMFRPGVRSMARGPEAVEKAIEDAGAREADKLHRSLRGLSVIAAVSPLLGLLGTVYGLIGAFQDAMGHDIGKGRELAKGIYEALVTTAAGLTIAIPVLLIYQLLRSRADRSVEAMGAMAEEFGEHYLVRQSEDASK